MAAWVTADEILVGSGAVASDPATASESDSEWAQACASAVSAGFDARLEGAVFASPPIEPPELPPELRLVARIAGIEAYKRREATFGITGYVDLQGAAIRVARDYLEAAAPVIARYATVGIA
jgi:hypothetical protein